MKTYRVYLSIIRKEKIKEIYIPVRGISEDDVRNYIETEFIPEIKNHETGIFHIPGAEYKIDRIAIRLRRMDEN